MRLCGNLTGKPTLRPSAFAFSPDVPVVNETDTGVAVLHPLAPDVPLAAAVELEELDIISTLRK